MVSNPFSRPAGGNGSPPGRVFRYVAGFLVALMIMRLALSFSDLVPASSVSMETPKCKEEDTTTTAVVATPPPPPHQVDNTMTTTTGGSATCPVITQGEKDGLALEIADYEKSSKFQDKMKEVKGEVGLAAHHVAINAYLRGKVLEPNWSVLELGCAAGGMLNMVEKWYQEHKHPYKEMVGVELVPGWVTFAKSYFPSISSKIQIFNGDVTAFTPLPDPVSSTTFDFVMLNDVAEHIQKTRYICFFQELQKVTHDDSIVYFHTPNPQAQLVDGAQHYENVLPHAYFVNGMAEHGFELVTMEQDVDTNCNNALHGSYPTTSNLRSTKCQMNGYTKYYHAVFRRVPQKLKSIFVLQ